MNEAALDRADILSIDTILMQPNPCWAGHALSLPNYHLQKYVKNSSHEWTDKVFELRLPRA
jgi:hypothetical protein